MSSAPTKKKYKKKQANKQTQRQQDNNSSIQSSVISSTINLTSTSILRRQSSKVEIEDLSTFILLQQTVKEFKFQYNFNQYLRLFLTKVLPPKNTQIKINPKEKTLRGPQVDSQKLIKRIKQQFQIYVMKVIKFNANADLEEVEFHLQKKYQIKIYKKKFLKLTIEDLVKHYSFVEQHKAFLKRIQAQQLILIRVQKKLQQECIQDINSLINQSAQVQQSKIQRPRMDMSQRLSKRPSTSSQQEIVEDQDEPTYYDSKIVSKVKPVFSQYAGNKFPKKIEEPTEDDSISVVGGKRNDKRKIQEIKYEQIKPIKREPIETREYQSESFDRKSFEVWVKNNKLLKGNVEVTEDKDPYDEKGATHTYIVKLFYTQNASKKQLTEQLDIYLKFRKVIFVRLKNQKYKIRLIQKHEKDEQALSIQFISGYKSPKWNQNQMWKHIVKKDYSQSKKSANTQYFQLFFLQGLKNLVYQAQKQIKMELQNQPLDDSNEQIIVKIDQLSDVLRSNQKLKEMIKRYIQKMIKTFKHCCQLNGVEYVLSNIKISLKVKFQQQEQYQKTIKDQIIEKITSQVRVHNLKPDSPITKFAYQKLQKEIIIIKKSDKQFTYASTVDDLPILIGKINNILNSLNNPVERVLVVEDKIAAKKIQEKVLEIKNEKEYSQINCNYFSDQSKFKLYGKEYLIQAVLKRLKECQEEILDKRINYIQIGKKKQADLLQEGTFLKDIYEKYQILVHTNKKQIECKITLRNKAENFKKKNILIIKSKNLDYAPYGCVIAFKNTQEIDLFKNYFIKTFRNYINKHKDESFNENSRKYTFLIKNKQTSQLLKDALAVNPNISNHIVMIMPEKGKEAFVKSIIKVLLEQKQYCDKQTTVIIIQYGLSADIQQHINISPYVKGKKIKFKDETITKYYVQDKGQKFFYSESGNRKILTAQQKGFSKIILYNQDLNITHESHEFHPQALQITHLQSFKSFPVTVNNNKIEFALINQVYEIQPPLSTNILSSITNKTSNPIKISLGVYQIDLSAMKQTNLFSGYQRRLCKQETILKADVNQDQIQAFYNYKVAQIEYSYYFQESLMVNFTNSRTEVVNFLSKSIKQKQISYGQFKNIDVLQLQTIRSTVQEDQQTQFSYNHTKKTISIKALDENSLNRCEQLCKIFLNNYNQRDPNKIKYPDNWEPQKQDIQVFQVKQNTPQFQYVQAKFTVGKVKKLTRIQNKIIYKKFFEESIFLQKLNGAKIKKMQLFHGTRSTNPQQIYKDKEESFNINYSSDNNLLGKGIYFAEKSEYSNNYRYTEAVGTGNIFGIGASNQYSMFLCDVLVGQSQKCKQHNGSIKDTSFKDQVNKIRYESMTDFLNNSNIYVVYKSRRAYPLYLIKY